MNSIEISEVKKSYGEVQAVRGVSLSVRPGELFGLIGPDGAGKTTLMRAITTLLLADKGEISVAGLDVRSKVAEIRAILGYMPQRFSLYQDLTVEQNLRFFAELFQVPAAERNAKLEQLYGFSRLEPFKKRQAGALSGGMKQKLALSCALIHTPQILVLDEPTFGVDPVSRKEFWDILREIQKQGTTILVSTAYMDEADQCDRVALFFSGEIKALDTPSRLKEGYPYPLYRVTGTDLRRIRSQFQSDSIVHSVKMFGDSLHISFSEEPDDARWDVWGQDSGGILTDHQKILPSVQDVFMEVMEGENVN